MITPENKTTRLILGIDGGGVSTVAWLATADAEQTVIGRGFSGPSNQRAVGPRMAMAHLDEAVQLAFDDAGLSRQTVDAACLGLVGSERSTDHDLATTWASEARLAVRLRVVNDVFPLLCSGKLDGIGIALIAGASSMAWGRNSQDESARSGGWGYLFGDDGSEFAIGRAILQAVTAFVDGRGPATCLKVDVCQALRVSSPAEIVGAIYSNEIPRAVIAGLAPLAFAAAERLDVVSCDIVMTAARDLSALVISVAKRLRMHNGLAVSLAGTLLIRHPRFCEMVIDAISSQGVHLTATHVVAEPVAGSVSLAYQLAIT